MITCINRVAQGLRNRDRLSVKAVRTQKSIPASRYASVPLSHRCLSHIKRRSHQNDAADRQSSPVRPIGDQRRGPVPKIRAVRHHPPKRTHERTAQGATGLSNAAASGVRAKSSFIFVWINSRKSPTGEMGTIWAIRAVISANGTCPMRATNARLRNGLSTSGPENRAAICWVQLGNLLGDLGD